MNRLNPTIAKPHLVSLAVLSAVGYQKSTDAEAHSVHDLKTDGPDAISKMIDRQSNLFGTVNATRSTPAFRPPHRRDQGMAGLVIGSTIYSEDTSRTQTFKQRGYGTH